MKEALDTLKATSRTFFIPISRLSPGLQESVVSAYLCMRAIDEVEDHEVLLPDEKMHILGSLGEALHTRNPRIDIKNILAPYWQRLPDVTRMIDKWITICPSIVLPTVLESVAAMAKGMSGWVHRSWKIRSVEDLDDYTYCVAGRVGELLSEIWARQEGVETNSEHAVSFGRGLQAVNILRNRVEDLARGVDFFPDGWRTEDMFAYARKHLTQADEYIKAIPPGPILEFCRIPLLLAHGTLEALENGHQKLSRDSVHVLVRKAIEQ